MVDTILKTTYLEKTEHPNCAPNDVAITIAEKLIFLDKNFVLGAYGSGNQPSESYNIC